MLHPRSRSCVLLFLIGAFATVVLSQRAVAEAAPTAARADSARTVTVGSIAPIDESQRLGVEDLLRGFSSPPAVAKPKTWWHWMDGNITKEGITADLEAMKQIGLGGAQIFSLDYQIPSGPVKFMTPEWREAVRFAAQEANRLGLELDMANSSGWSSTGGPWITPNLAMQRVVWSETRVAGSARFEGVLAKPEAGKYGAYYRDIAVLAFETPPAEKITLRSANPKITPENLELPTPSDAKPQTALFEFAQPFTARALFFNYVAGSGMVDMAVQASDDGVTFKTIATTRFRQHAQLSVAFPETSARFFRFLLTGSPIDNTPVTFSKLELLDGYRLPDWPGKVGAANLARLSSGEAPPAPAGTIYQREHMIDLSDKIDAAGNLAWTPTAGDWTIFRFGYAPNGQGSAHPNVPEGSGLEVDKLSKEALELHFKSMIDPLLKELGPLAGKTFAHLVIDSYEVGAQNWTAKFREEFRRRRAYDLVSYLPALTGRVVDSADVTERFLWDIRRTIAELFAENYYGHFADLCHERGLTAAFEAYGGPFSSMDTTALADLPMAEFWTGKGGNRRPAVRTRLVVSGAHAGGQQVVGAEAFTSSFGSDRYSQDPYSLKSLGDFQFCEGINRFIFHRFAMQPWLDQAPGMTMGPWGLHFDRTNTWWNQGRAWIDYLSRSQYLLQKGKLVADVLCFAGEDSQSLPYWGLSELPTLPNGHDFEFVNVSSLLSASVEDHRIVLPNGSAFPVLVLSDTRRMTPAVATKIAALVTAGARVIGPPPTQSPSLSDSRASDETVRQVAAQLWGGCDGQTVTEHVAGQGTVFWGKSIAEVFERFSIRPDFVFTNADAGVQLCFTHRTLPTEEVYFISNQQERTEAFEGNFRVTGLVPALWHSDTGIIEPVPVYREKNGVVTIPMQLDPAGSIFVVFRKSVADGHAVALTQTSLPSSSVKPLGQLSNENGALTLNAWSSGDYTIESATGRKTNLRVAAVPEPLTLKGSWSVQFPPRLGAPDTVTLAELGSLSKHSEFGVRYFSGTATYRKEFDLSAEQLKSVRELYVDLGTVKNIAELKVNNVDLGIMWKPPFRVRATSALHAGKNLMEIRVTNLWANRLIGDEQLPDDCEWIAVPSRGLRLKEWPGWFVEHQPRPSARVAFATWKFYSKNDPLPDSGLIGPVTIAFMERVKVESSAPGKE